MNSERFVALFCLAGYLALLLGGVSAFLPVGGWLEVLGEMVVSLEVTP